VALNQLQQHPASPQGNGSLQCWNSRQALDQSNVRRRLEFEKYTKGSVFAVTKSRADFEGLQLGKSLGLCQVA